jgi:hypothetical protein
VSSDQPLFVGGPWHGRRHPVPHQAGHLPYAYNVLPPMPPMTFDYIDGPPSIPDPVSYQLRHYDLVDDNGGSQLNAYVTRDGALYGQGCPAAAVADVRLADHLLRELDRASLPFCIAPNCESLAPMLFVADEYGRLGGRDWQPGDRIRLCPPHAHDIYQAQGVYGRDQLAEWLRPDAKLDPLDAYDAALDSLFAHEITEFPSPDAPPEDQGAAMRLRRDDRSEQILRELAMWVVIMRDRSDRMAQKVAEEMLLSAALIHYQDRTDRMDSTAAARWIRARVDQMVTQTAQAVGPLTDPPERVIDKMDLDGTDVDGNPRFRVVESHWRHVVRDQELANRLEEIASLFDDPGHPAAQYARAEARKLRTSGTT